MAVLQIIGRDELGVIYGMLHYSRTVLGVDPFWYWAELPPAMREAVALPLQNYDSLKPKVRYRGWFVNDEVCLIGWKERYPPSEEVWLPVLEALMRCGGNMVIPGTDLPCTGIHHKLASEMGLWITHHYAEPLGADQYLLVNANNLLQHLYPLDIVSELWTRCTAGADERLLGFIERQYASRHGAITSLYREFVNCTIPYGPHPDDRAGEELADKCRQYN